MGHWAPIEHLMDEMGVHTRGAVFDEAVDRFDRPGNDGWSSESLPSSDGAEHYRDTFDPVVAVGAPIVHASTVVVEGVIDIVAPTVTPWG